MSKESAKSSFGCLCRIGDNKTCRIICLFKICVSISLIFLKSKYKNDSESALLPFTPCTHRTGGAIASC